MNITDQLAQALEGMWEYYKGHMITPALHNQVQSALSAYRASKEGEVEYRMLEDGDVIQSGDEVFSTTRHKWVKARLSIGEAYAVQHEKHRRPIRAT